MLNRQLWQNLEIQRQEYYQVTAVKNGLDIEFKASKQMLQKKNFHQMCPQIWCYPFVLWETYKDIILIKYQTESDIRKII